ncbi:hypothetical protein LGK95_08245 [Clostridium algoriphilum]|uniref:hypothetical protein n=1 Tax=Clostridium algoriphilum TaxID=198347 RepID=UPI001CF3D9A4|nr:hypothetical protein [Clostridium algoriphilum]MCB2293510.1 hypothetical protein [Clostridium algoriphilum]
MDNELFQILSQIYYEKLERLQDDIKDIKNNQVRIEKKLNLMIAKLTELLEVKIETNSQSEDFKNVDAITPIDLSDITKFKTAK